MKALANTQQESTTELEQGEQHKRLAEMRLGNVEKETAISGLEEQVALLEGANAALRGELVQYEQEWEAVQKEEEQKSEEDEQEMQEWMENVQKQNGVPQAVLDSLLSVEFEGAEQEICPACYQELAVGSMCTYLPCAHLFHQDCIVNHLKVNTFCLACQEEVRL